jgi:hypothetical protein
MLAPHPSHSIIPIILAQNKISLCSMYIKICKRVAYFTSLAEHGRGKKKRKYHKHLFISTVNIFIYLSKVAFFTFYLYHFYDFVKNLRKKMLDSSADIRFQF